MLGPPISEIYRSLLNPKLPKTPGACVAIGADVNPKRTVRHGLQAEPQGPTQSRDSMERKERARDFNMSVLPEFHLRFPVDEIGRWAKKSLERLERSDRKKQKECNAQLAANAAANRGYMTMDEFRTIALWKSPRPKRWIDLNTPEDVHEATQGAFSTPNPYVRIGSLLTLSGVKYPMASAILHLVKKDVPLLDVNALAALNVGISSYDFRFWKAYCDKVAGIQVQTSLSFRTIDRALWEFGDRNRLA